MPKCRLLIYLDDGPYSLILGQFAYCMFFSVHQQLSLLSILFVDLSF